MIEYEFQFGLGYVYAQQHVMSMPVFRNVSEENKTDKKDFSLQNGLPYFVRVR